MPATAIIYGTCAEQAATGVEAWTNPTNASGGSNGTYAESGVMSVGEDTNVLHFTAFDFAGAGLGSGDTILGVEIFITKAMVSTDSIIADKLVRCLNAGTQAGDNVATATQWPTGGVLTEVSYGGAALDLSTGMTAADWLLSTSGVAVQAHRTAGTGSPRNARVDSVGIRITYSEPVSGIIKAAQHYYRNTIGA